jgi:hypothetical protein
VCCPRTLLALVPYHSSVELLPRAMKTRLEQRGFWHDVPKRSPQAVAPNETRVLQHDPGSLSR